MSLCNPLDCSPSGSSVYGIFQARILEWVVITFYQLLGNLFLNSRWNKLLYGRLMPSIFKRALCWLLPCILKIFCRHQDFICWPDVFNELVERKTFGGGGGRGGAENKNKQIFVLRVNKQIYVMAPGIIFSQFSSVAQSCRTLCKPMNHSTPGLPVHHQLLESTQTHVHWVSDAIQPSHPLSSPSPHALNLSQHQGLFKWVSSSHQVAKVLGVSASTSVLPMNTQDWSPLGWTGWISLQSMGLSRVFSNTTIWKHQFFDAQLYL